MSAIMMVHATSKPATVVTVSGTSMRELLSASGKTTYDATANDSWFSVSASDYNSVASGLVGTSKIGMSDTDINTLGVAFVGTFGTTLPKANCTVPVGNYVIGFVFRGSSTVAATARPYISTTYKGTYTTIGSNSCSAAATSDPVYFLRKNPASATAATSYVASGPRSSGNWSCVSNWNSGGYSLNMSSWTSYTGQLPNQQYLISTTAT